MYHPNDIDGFHGKIFTADGRLSRRSHSQIPQNKKPIKKWFSKVGGHGAKPMDVNFRKIDIDQFDEEVLKDSELYESDPRDPTEALEDAKQKQVAVRGLLAR